MLDSTSSDQHGFRDFVREARIIGRDERGQPKDDRVPLIDLARDNSWSQEKLQFALRNAGRIFCPFQLLSTDGKPAPLSAALVGTDVTVLTAAHLFYDDNGQPKWPIEELNLCSFQNFSNDSSPLDIRPGTYQIGRYERKRLKSDWMVVRLEKPLRGATGFPVDLSGEVLAKGRKLVNVSGLHVGSLLPRDIASAQYCSNYQHHRPSSADPHAYLLTDCDSSPGNSGSILLGETGRDGLIAAGVVSGHNYPREESTAADGDPFHPQTNSEIAQAIGERIILAINLVAGDRTLQTVATKLTNDKRKALSNLAEELHWPKDVADNFRKVTGHVACQVGSKMVPLASGAIVGTDLTLLTAAHVFANHTGALRSNNLQCYFQNRASPRDTVPLMFKEGSYKIPHVLYNFFGGQDDWAVVRLARPIPNIRPLPVGTVHPVGREVIRISAIEEDVTWVPRTEPIAQICEHWRLYYALMMTNCDSAPGASGGVLVTKIENTFVAVGVHVAMGALDSFGPLNRAGYAIALDSEIVRAIEKVSGKKIERENVSQAPVSFRQ